MRRGLAASLQGYDAIVQIGLIAPPWLPTPPPLYGGTEQIVDLLARGLVAMGHDVVLFATGDSTCPVERRWVYDTPAPQMCETVPEAYHVVRAYQALADVDVIHDHTILGPLVSSATSFVPVVATNHGPFTEQTKAIYAAASSQTSIVAISKSQAATAGRHVRIAAVIPHGIDVESFPVGSGAGGYVAFLGRMAPAKGAHTAIEAAQRAGIPIKLAAKCREPSERAYFEEFVRPRLGPDVEFLGEVGGADKHRLLGEAIALVNPITWPEPFGLVMAEALACGTPVVTTQWGAAPEIVDHGLTGLLCSNTEELIRSLPAVFDIDRRTCRRVAETRLSAARMVRDHIALYERVSSGATLMAV